MVCLLVACESSAESGEAAFEDAKEARTTLADSTAISDLVASNETGKPAHMANVGTHATRAAKPTPDAWTLFQRKTEGDIVANEALIHRLKGLPDNAKLLKRTSQVESDNTELRTLVSDFLRNEQESRANFQAKVAQSLKDISDRLNELNGRAQ